MIEESQCYPLRAAQAGNAFQKDFVVIPASFCIMGGSRSSRAHPSFSRGELGCAHAAVPTKPCPGTVGAAGLPLELWAQGGEIKPSPGCKEGSDRGALHVLLSWLCLPLGPKCPAGTAESGARAELG